MSDEEAQPLSRGRGRAKSRSSSSTMLKRLSSPALCVSIAVSSEDRETSSAGEGGRKQRSCGVSSRGRPVGERLLEWNRSMWGDLEAC